MAWIYCDACGEGMDSPSIREVLTGNYYCPRCGSNNAERLSEDDTKDAMTKLLDRLEALEAKHV